MSEFKLRNQKSGREVRGTFGTHEDPRTRIAALRTQIARDWEFQVTRGAGMKDAVTNAEYAALGLLHLREEIKHVGRVVLPGQVFRASKAGRTHASEETPEYFLPPPARLRDGSALPAGRFNDVGSRALYLASQRDILPAEMTQRGVPGTFCVARITLDIEDARIADLTPGATRNLPHVNALVGEAERRRTDSYERIEQDPYGHTILLRHELESAGFQGAAYPSVHDNHHEDPDGFNIVFFDDSLFEAVVKKGWMNDVSREQFHPAENEL